MRKLATLLALSLLAAPAHAQDIAPPLVQAENAFAIDLYGQLRQQPGNLFFSPSSISTALSMVYVGAKGGTAAEIAQVLHLPPKWSQADFLKAVPQPVTSARSDAFQLHAANALWGAQGYNFHHAYIASIKTNFGGALYPTNFNNPDAAAGKINAWVSDQTQGKIPNLISPGALTPATRLVLTNAIYFKAAWNQPFDKSATDQQAFHLAPGNDTPVRMMHMTSRFPLAQADGAQILTLPYRGDASMVIILPTHIDGLAALATSLSTDELNDWSANSPQTLVELSLPKFTSTSNFNLNDVLQKLGMKDSFAPGTADFSGIATDPVHPLYIGAVIHNAYIGVDESKTEAAAATGIIMVATASAPEAPVTPVPFTADHPFLYLIRDNATGAILFMGRVENPSEP
jgi:serpin B